MSEDPIVAEVRAIRREIQEESGNDSKVFFENLRRIQETYSDRQHLVVSDTTSRNHIQEGHHIRGPIPISGDTTSGGINSLIRKSLSRSWIFYAVANFSSIQRWSRTSVETPNLPASSRTRPSRSFSTAQ